jgi:hypothetical protein
MDYDDGWDELYEVGMRFVSTACREGQRFTSLEEVVRWARRCHPFSSRGNGRGSMPGLVHVLPPSGGGTEELILRDLKGEPCEVWRRKPNARPGLLGWEPVNGGGGLLGQLLTLIQPISR